MKGLVEYIVKALVDKPELVALRHEALEGGQVFELRVAPEDIGKVIGRDGRTVNALRSLLSFVGQRKGERVRLEIFDDKRPQAVSPGPPPEV